MPSFWELCGLGRRLYVRDVTMALRAGCRKATGLDDTVQIRVHALHDDVQLITLLIDGEVHEGDDVGVLAAVPEEPFGGRAGGRAGKRAAGLLTRLRVVAGWST